ncbi:MAG: Bacterial alpha-L-rhamnosidase [Betaproteobacteria bacterium ADurb.Bin341]|nr:MAG: Bacterial alpha-L-rhamnosidase [Betaproteobacteria bacterium ADurb.Bin341]
MISHYLSVPSLITRSALLIAAAAICSVRAAAAPAFAPQQWWLVGPYACYSAADFEANEPIENAKNSSGREWNRVVGMGGRELRTLVVDGAAPGLVDLECCLGPVPTNVCAYAGALIRAEKGGTATATLTASGSVRWFMNNKLVAETKQAGVQKAEVTLVAGLNSLLAKSWKTGGEWKVGCTLEGLPLTAEAAPATVQPVKPLTGRRNVALWSEGSHVAVSSVVWRGFPLNERGLSVLNDGRRDGAWTSLEVDLMPQWAWVRFPGLRKIDEIVVHAASADRRPLELVGETTEDGGVTFKALFKVTDPKELSIQAKFPSMSTDNVRIRIERAAVPSRTGFEQVQLSEIEVFGEDATGEGSLAMAAAEPKEPPASRLETDKKFKPTVQADEAVATVSTPWYRIALDQRRPRIAQLQLDSLGKGEFKINLLRRSGAAVLVATLFDRPAFLPEGKLVFEGNVARYPAVTVAPGVKLQMALRFNEKSFDLELTTASARNIPLDSGVFRFDLDFWQTPTTFFGRSTDCANVVALPCYLHAPDAGTFHVTQSGDAAIFRQCASADDFSLSARQFMNIAPREGVLPKGVWQSTLRFDVDAPRAFPELTAKEPRLEGMPRYALNIAQWTPSKRVLINNVVSTPCLLSLQFYAEMGVYAPVLADGVSLMDLVVPSVDGYLNGLGSHLYWHGLKVDVTPPGTWTASLESPGFLINSAWYAVHTVGGKPLLARWLPRLEAVAGHLEAHDTDGDGIVDSVDTGHWFDTYKLPAGVKEAHSTAVNYEAFGNLAELEELAGNSEKAAHYRARAKLIKDNYLKMFFNPETGVIGGWRDKEGKLHDRMFPWVNGYAICVGLVDDALAKSIVEKFVAKMKEIGFGEAQYKYGMLTNLLPMENDEWNHHGAHAWQGYMNGSITPPYSHYFLMALYRHGFRDVAEKMLWAQVESFDKGTFNAGVRIPYMPQRNPVGSAFYTWDGAQSVGEGYLPENWHAYASLFAGHYGIRFDKDGYTLEAWSPLKGKKVRCGMPVMGKIQEFMQ